MENLSRRRKIKKIISIMLAAIILMSFNLSRVFAESTQDDEKVRVFSDCITIANSGSVGASFYHPYEFIASDHVTSLRTKENLAQFESLFLTTLLSRLEETYSFNREINDVRIKRQKVLLPTDENGYVNFSYMEKYMKSLEMKKQVQILDYLIKDIT